MNLQTQEWSLLPCCQCPGNTSQLCQPGLSTTEAIQKLESQDASKEWISLRMKEVWDWVFSPCDICDSHRGKFAPMYYLSRQVGIFTPLYGRWTEGSLPSSRWENRSWWIKSSDMRRWVPLRNSFLQLINKDWPDWGWINSPALTASAHGLVVAGFLYQSWGWCVSDRALWGWQLSPGFPTLWTRSGTGCSWENHASPFLSCCSFFLLSP